MRREGGQWWLRGRDFLVQETEPGEYKCSKCGVKLSLDHQLQEVMEHSINDHMRADGWPGRYALDLIRYREG